MKKKIELTEEQQITLAFHIASGIRDMHASNFVHCDLKDSNILLIKSNDFYKAKVADLGLAEINQNASRLHSVTSIKEQNGSIFWQAPEVVLGAQHSQSSDIFSFGLILWRIVSHGAALYDDKDENLLPTVTADLITLYIDDMAFRLTIPGNCMQLLRTIIEGCWRPIYKRENKGRKASLHLINDAPKRFSANDIVEMILKDRPDIQNDSKKYTISRTLLKQF